MFRLNNKREGGSTVSRRSEILRSTGKVLYLLGFGASAHDVTVASYATQNTIEAKILDRAAQHGTSSWVRNGSNNVVATTVAKLGSDDLGR